MPEELQDLLDRIQKQGVDKAEADARRILERAEAEAAEIRRKASEDARALVAGAEADAGAFEERARRALAQAARDLVLSVGESLQATLRNLVAAEIRKVMDSRVLGETIQSLVSGYFASASGGIEVSLPEDRRKEVADYLFARFKDELAGGVEIKGDRNIASGFRIRELGGEVVHDFSAEAIAESLSALLRPHLAEIVRAAVVQPGGEAGRQAG
jgi:V/A-type H+-transporting ATPase subunit E